MKKIALFLSIIMIFGCCFSITACDSSTASNNNSSERQEIVLTKDNFKDYFTIEVDSDIDITKHGDTYILGVYVAPTYSAVADVDVNVFASSPLESYNVVLTLEVKTGYVYWNTKTITLNLTSNGSAQKNVTVTTSDEKDIYFEMDCNKEFYASIVSVEGTIKTR